jgi:hypothetical protein
LRLKQQRLSIGGSNSNLHTRRSRKAILEKLGG